MSEGGVPLAYSDEAVLERESWSEYFDSLAQPRRRLLAAVALPGPDGDACWEDGDRPLHGISYNRPCDEIEIAVRLGPGLGAALRYFVDAPRAIVLEEAAPAVTLLRVTDARGAQTLIRLRESTTGLRAGSHSPARASRAAGSRLDQAPSA